MDDKFLTVEDVMEILQISKKQARALFHSEEFKGSFKLGKSYRISEKDFNAWLENTKEKGECNIQSYKH